MEELKVYSNVTQYIKIEMGAETFGIDISFIDNIIRMQRITRVPNVPEYIKGVINLRGEIVPIINLRSKMGLEEVEYTKATRIIIIKMEQIGKAGFIVDCVKEVVPISEEQVENVKYDTADDTPHFVSAVGKEADSIISLLDLNAVVLDRNFKEENA